MSGRAVVIASRVEKSKKKPRSSTCRSHYCPHCERNLTLKTFKRHQKLFCSNGIWTRAEDTESEEEEEQCEEGTRCAIMG